MKASSVLALSSRGVTRRSIVVGFGACIVAGLFSPKTPKPQDDGWFMASRLGPMWRSQFLRCSTPGPRVFALLDGFNGSRSRKLGQAYNWLAGRFDYVQLSGTNDIFIAVEQWLALPTPAGNCVHVAAFFTSCARALAFPVRVVATAADFKVPAHVQSQVFANPDELLEFEEFWGVATGDLPTCNQWLALDGGVPPAAVRVGEVETIIYVQPARNERKL